MDVDTNRLPLIGLSLTIGLVLFLAAILALSCTTEQPEADLGALSGDPDPATIYVNSAAVAADTNGTGYTWGRYSLGDLYYRIDQTDAATNTTSLEIETSPDGTNWYDHVMSGTLLADNAADANGYVAEIPANGYFWRIVVNVSNTNTVTPDLKMVLR